MRDGRVGMRDGRGRVAAGGRGGGAGRGQVVGPGVEGPGEVRFAPPVQGLGEVGVGAGEFPPVARGAQQRDGAG
ncbi:hypothetical protein DN402_05445 [Streptomyces sp. SW4]|nr:hypothetical protein DN402_05445 [Streptomyces sp. SW4]